MSPMDTILGRIKKLLALTVERGATPEEAATAAAKAQDLLFEHNLSMSAIETHEIGTKAEELEDIEMEIEGSTRDLSWKRNLLHGVAKNNFCAAITITGTTSINVVGKRSNVIVVEYMTEYLEAEIKRLAKIAVKDVQFEKGTFVTNFCLGAVETIRERLRLQQQQNETKNAECTALVVQSKGALEKAFRKFYPHTTKGSAPRITNCRGFDSGREAGRHIGLNKGIGNARATQGQLA